MILVAMATKPKPTPCGPIVSGQVLTRKSTGKFNLE